MDELKDLIAAKLDVTQFLDILGYELPDILDKFEEEINGLARELEAACRQRTYVFYPQNVEEKGTMLSLL